MLCFGCVEGAKLAHETDSGGIVTYPFGESGPLLSSFRQEALRIMEKRCMSAYRIVREGEARGRSRIDENATGPEVIRQRRWGIQFECK
jgi:hypothetical protein